MFNADLSWKESGAERLGERRHRKEREKAATPAGYASSTSGPSTSSSGYGEKKPKSASLSEKLAFKFRLPIFGKKHSPSLPKSEQVPVWKLDRTPTLLQQKGRTPERLEKPQVSPFANAFGSTAIGHGTQHEDNDSEIVVARASPEQFCKTYDDVKNRIMAMQAMQYDSSGTMPRILSSSSVEGPNNIDSSMDELWEYDSEAVPYSTGRVFSPSQARIVNCPRPRQKRSLQMLSSGYMTQDSTSLHGRSSIVRPPSSQSEGQVSTWSSSHRPDGSISHDHILRLIRRMRAATTRVVVDRLREEWRETSDPSIREELQLEKTLWAMVASEHTMLDAFSKSGHASEIHIAHLMQTGSDKNILNIDGSLAELYFVASSSTRSHIVHLVAPDSATSTLTLPEGVTRHQMPNIAYPTAIIPGVLSGGVGGRNLSLPYTSLSVHAIKSSRIATLLPIPQLLPLLADCYRVLKPGGTLELRIVDAIPDRGTTGPRLASWLKDNFLINLDRDLRCQQPCSVIPRWAAQAGFVMAHRAGVELLRKLSLPAAAPTTRYDEASSMASIVLHELWKDTWGKYVGKKGASVTWWWHDRAILQECVEWNTRWDLGWLQVIKQEHDE